MLLARPLIFPDGPLVNHPTLKNDNCLNLLQIFLVLKKGVFWYNW